MHCTMKRRAGDESPAENAVTGWVVPGDSSGAVNGDETAGHLACDVPKRDVHKLG